MCIPLRDGTLPWRTVPDNWSSGKGSYCHQRCASEERSFYCKTWRPELALYQRWANSDETCLTVVHDEETLEHPEWSDI